MSEIGHRRKCSFHSCLGEMVLKEKGHLPGGAIPNFVKLGGRFKETDHLRAWECTTNPKHVEVEGWGLRPVKDCTVKGCGRVMVHSGKAPTTTPENLRRHVRLPYSNITYQSGYICLDNPEHFEPDAKDP